jgi:hypothetical protein
VVVVPGVMVEEEQSPYLMSAGEGEHVSVPVVAGPHL